MKQEKLNVSHVERFATHDGPGIRTTVFLKGCPLHCPWCSNPETQSFHPALLHNKETCCHCGFCADACPNHALTVTKDSWVFDPCLCDACGRCIWACTLEALELRGESESIEELADLCERDRDYYEESGGGITVSGGEPMAQTTVLADFIDELHDRGMTVALETCLQAPTSNVKSVVERVDHVLCDCKHVDARKLQDVTGAVPDAVLGNLAWIGRHASRKTRVRVPVIPGFNYTEPELVAIIDWLADAGFEAIDLLPYHAFAIGKYDRLGREYAFPRSSLPEEDLEPYRAYAESRGLDCRIGA